MAGQRREGAADKGSGVYVCRCFPGDDEAFEAFVARCNDTLLEAGVDEPEALERLVRHRYPRVVVRPQTDLAATRRTRVWYVYREGRALPDGASVQ